MTKFRQITGCKFKQSNSRKNVKNFPIFIGNKVKQITLKFSCKIHSSLRLFFIKEAKTVLLVQVVSRLFTMYKKVLFGSF